jgi:hypothetical protein
MTNKSICYTCLVGDYDEIKSPSYISQDWDYVCFTDQPLGNQVGVWKIRPLKKVIKGDPTRTNRWHKMHPHLLFPDHEVSIYIDANIGITGPHLENKLNDLQAGPHPIAIPAHPLRDCVYDEAIECMACKLDKLSLIQGNNYILRNAGYPEKNGLYENNLIIRKHHEAALKELAHEWWEILCQYSKRDQLSLVYLLWKHQIQVLHIAPPGETIRKHPDYKYTLHTPRPANQPAQTENKRDKRSKVARLLSSFIPVPKWRRKVRSRLKKRNALELEISQKIRRKWVGDKKRLPLTRAHRQQYDLLHRFHLQVIGEFPHLTNPQSYNDKIAWLMLFDQQQVMIQCTDKFKVREFVENRIGKKYLNEIYTTGDSFDCINFESLPEAFVIKTNHDSGTVILVKNKELWDPQPARAKIQSALSKPYGVEKGEWPYQFIRRKIIVEKYLDLAKDKLPVDYKFHCVDGQVKWLQYIFDRGNDTKEIIFDRNFNRLPFHLDNNFIKSDLSPQRPENWEQLVDIAEKLASGFKYVRVDLYNVDEEILFGELTFFPMSGCYASLDLHIFGEMMDFSLESYSTPFAAK